MPSGVPALQRGLAIVEKLAFSDDAVGFNELMKELELPRATCARLLQVLRDEGYAEKDAASGRYRPGPKLSAMAARSTLKERVRSESLPILEELVRQTGNTAISFYWDGKELHSLAKEMHPAAVPLQEVGNRASDLRSSPWAWTIYETLPRERRDRMHSVPGKHPASRRKIAEGLRFYRQHGFAFDGELFPLVRRLGVPIRGADGSIVGALALGGNALTMPDEQLFEIGAQLVEAAERVSRSLGFSEKDETK